MAHKQEKPNTLYPKITGNFADLMWNIDYRRKNDSEVGSITTIPMTGTVKLHGAHADLLIDSDNMIRLQSRNMPELSLENDLYGFAAHMLPLKSEILALKSRIQTRFLELNPGVGINEQHPLIIAGEWIGPKIQKKVAICELPKRILVIISININDSWLPDEPYGDIHDEESGIYHVSKGGFYHHDLPIENADSSLRSLQPLADAVENECPFGKAFGITGRGEGIVWKPAPPLCGDARYWLKMKGPLSKVTLPAERKPADGGGDQSYAKEFAQGAVGEMRLEQGWQYMAEMGIERNKKGVVDYLRWLNRDVEVEEKSEIEKRGVNKGFLKKEIEAIGRQWYFKQLAEEGK